jgi:hypothetical protein
MDRRIFLASLAGGITSGASIAHSAAPAIPPAMIRTYVSNVSDAHRSAPLPKPGSRLSLRVDASRKYDPGSVLVATAEGETLGYLPTTHGRIIGPLISGGFELGARVLTSKTLPRPAIQIEISLR